MCFDGIVFGKTLWSFPLYHRVQTYDTCYKTRLEEEEEIGRQTLHICYSPRGYKAMTGRLGHPSATFQQDALANFHALGC